MPSGIFCHNKRQKRGFIYVYAQFILQHKAPPTGVRRRRHREPPNDVSIIWGTPTATLSIATHISDSDPSVVQSTPSRMTVGRGSSI